MVLILSAFFVLVKDESPKGDVDDAAEDVDGKGYFHLSFTKKKTG